MSAIADRFTYRANFERECRRLATRDDLGDNIVKSTVFGKWPIFVDQRDKSLAHWLITTGFWESWITLAIMNRIQPDWACIDVGANFGYYTLLMAHRGARALAVEPNPLMVDLLKRTIEANALTNCEIVKTAAWSRHEEILRLQVPEEHYGGATITASTTDGLTCTGDAIDDLVADWERVDLIKIDAEGAEPEIWEGMLKTLAKHSPRVVMEFTPSRYVDARRFACDIVSRGYPLKVIDGASNLIPYTPEKLAGVSDLVMLWLERGP